jgi:Flp pilus assembly protein TadG
MRRRGDSGALSVEYVIVAPMILLLFALIYAMGLVAQVDGVLDAGTRDAARAASLAGSYTEATTAATNIVKDELGGASPSCLGSLKVQVLPEGRFDPGETITVRTSCSYDLHDKISGLPGSVTVTSQFASMIDPNRSLG